MTGYALSIQAQSGTGESKTPLLPYGFGRAGTREGDIEDIKNLVTQKKGVGIDLHKIPDQLGLEADYVNELISEIEKTEFLIVKNGKVKRNYDKKVYRKRKKMRL
jgi:hypothetical protein